MESKEIFSDDERKELNDESRGDNFPFLVTSSLDLPIKEEEILGECPPHIRIK
jgi:hypothetical protein